MINPELDGRVALVTGIENPRGIGAATAAALARQGVAVFGTTCGEDGREVTKRIAAAGGRIATAAVDLSDPAVIPSLFDQVHTTFGPVEILVNNAAHSVPDCFHGSDVDWADRPLAQLTAATHDRHFALNSRAPALLIAELVRRHAARGADWGRVITISTSGARVFPGEVSYGASKWAAESFSRAAARELGALGITVNIVAPGPIQTGWIPPDLEPALAADTPLGRVGTPEDVADVVVFLTSVQARWVTGQHLHVGGGHTI